MDPVLAAALVERGWWWGTSLASPHLTAALHRELMGLASTGALAPARMGRAAGYRLDAAVRGDHIRWLDATTQPQREVLEELERLREALNRSLMLGLVDCEAHFALYAPGAGYARHVDRFTSSDRRVVSLALYLNDDWQASDGGALVIYEPDGATVAAHILPRAGTYVLMMSEAIVHEVRPAHRPRASIAAWFRRRARLDAGATAAGYF